jgi:hypothetical protein
MAAMITIRAEQAASHALRAASPARAGQFPYRTGTGSARSLQFIPEFQSTKSASLKDNFAGLFVATSFPLGPSSLGSGYTHSNVEEACARGEIGRREIQYLSPIRAGGNAGACPLVAGMA